jgi:hypothetical protein
MENISIMVLPFVINGHDKPSDAFKSNYVRDVFGKRVHRRFVEKLDRLDLNQSNILDMKHHPFLHDFISIKGYPDQVDADRKSINTSVQSQPVLQVYDITLDRLNKPVISDPANVASRYRRSNDLLYLDEYFRIDIVKIYIVDNEYSGLGYFIIAFKLSSSNTNFNYADKLSGLKFFRFYRESDIDGDPDYKIKYINRKLPYVPGGPCFSIEEYIRCQFSELLSDIQFLNIKPVMLHLINGEVLKSFTKKSHVHNTLRIQTPITASPPLTMKSSQADIVRMSSGILFCAMNEGAMVLDTSQIDNMSMIKKYLPAFLISLNQREILIQLNRILQGTDFIRTDVLRTSTKKVATVGGMESRLGSNSDVTFDKTGLVNLRERITLYQLKQVFYSISFYEEIDAFYRKLQNVFNVELLLEDNRQSIKEINTLLGKMEQDSEERRFKKYQDRSNAFLVLISVTQLIDLLFPETWYNEDKIFGMTVKVWHFCASILFSVIIWSLIHFEYSRKKK